MKHLKQARGTVAVPSLGMRGNNSPFLKKRERSPCRDARGGRLITNNGAVDGVSFPQAGEAGGTATHVR